MLFSMFVEIVRDILLSFSRIIFSLILWDNEYVIKKFT